MAASTLYNIKYPFTIDNSNGFIIDINQSRIDSIRSKLVYVMFTPVGSRIMKPTFGTNLIKFIFEPNDTKTLGEIKSEIQTQISKYVPDCKITNLSINKNKENDLETVVSVQYEIKEGVNLITEDNFSIII